MAKEIENKLVSFHNITGIQDVLLFHQILEDHTKIWRQL
jgi:hypothetical protein